MTSHTHKKRMTVLYTRKKKTVLYSVEYSQLYLYTHLQLYSLPFVLVSFTNKRLFVYCTSSELVNIGAIFFSYKLQT